MSEARVGKIRNPKSSAKRNKVRIALQQIENSLLLIWHRPA